MRAAALAVAITLLAVAALPAAKLLALAGGAVAVLVLARRTAWRDALLNDARGVQLILLSATALAIVLLAAILAEDPVLAFEGTRLGAVPLALIIGLTVAAAGILRSSPQRTAFPAAPLAVAAWSEPALASVAVWLAISPLDRWIALAAASAWTIWHGSWAGAAGLAAGALFFLRRDWKLPAAAAATCIAAAFRAPAFYPQLLLWRDAMLAVLRRPLFGFGPENFQPSFARWESAELAQASPAFFFTSAGNAAINIAFSTGLFGLLVFLYVGAKLTQQSAGRTAALAFLAAYTLTGLTPASLLLFGLLAAMLYASAGPKPLGVPSDEEDLVIHQTVGERLVETRVTASGHKLQVVRKKVRKRAKHKRRGLIQSLPALAPAALRVVQGVLITGSLAAIWLTAKPLLEPQAPDAWTREVRKAANPGEDYVQTAYRLASLAQERNDLKIARSLAQQAVDSAPNWYKPRWLLAQILEAEGRRPRARAEATQALRLVPHANHADRAALSSYLRSLD